MAQRSDAGEEEEAARMTRATASKREGGDGDLTRSTQRAAQTRIDEDTRAAVGK